MKKRIISAAILVAITALFVLLSPITRVLFFAAAGLGCSYELINNYKKISVKCSSLVNYLYLVFSAILTLMHADSFWFIACLFIFVCAAFFTGIANSDIGGKGAVYSVFSLVYPCVFAVIIMNISISSIWIPTLLSSCLASWICDSFALFGGVKYGKHKVAPLVSPNKSTEGCIFGAIGAIITGFLVFYLLKNLYPLPLWLCIITCLISSSMGQIGDLAESLIKRYLGIKDFSDLIPGHGGIFDRSDSLLFAIPSAYFIIKVFGTL